MCFVLENISYLFIIEMFSTAHAFLTLQDQHLMIKENLLLGHHDSTKGFVQSADYGYLTVSVTFRPVSSVRKSGQLGTTITSYLNNFLVNEKLIFFHFKTIDNSK